jgi:hypothetical protein
MNQTKEVSMNARPRAYFMSRKTFLRVGFLALTLSLSACDSLLTKHVEWETIEPESYPVLNAVGYAPITAQIGLDPSSKRLMAIKASKLDAYRELAEQVYGQKVDGQQALANLVLTDNQLKTSVEGVIRGARVIKTYPVGDDTYATELELDMGKVHDIYLSMAKPKKIRKVTYY